MSQNELIVDWNQLGSTTIFQNHQQQIGTNSPTNTLLNPTTVLYEYEQQQQQAVSQESMNDPQHEAERLSASLSLYMSDNRVLVMAFLQTLDSVQNINLTVSWIFMLSNILIRLENNLKEITQIMNNNDNNSEQLAFEVKDLSDAIIILYGRLKTSPNFQISIPILWMANSERSLSVLRKLSSIHVDNDDDNDGDTIASQQQVGKITTRRNCGDKNRKMRRRRRRRIGNNRKKEINSEQKQARMRLIAKKYLKMGDPNDQNCLTILENSNSIKEHEIYRLWSRWYIFGEDEILHEIIDGLGIEKIKAYLGLIYKHRDEPEHFEALKENIREFKEQIFFESLLHNSDFMDRVCDWMQCNK